jgi:hypothetical protein
MPFNGAKSFGYQAGNMKTRKLPQRVFTSTGVSRTRNTSWAFQTRPLLTLAKISPHIITLSFHRCIDQNRNEPISFAPRPSQKCGRGPQQMPPWLMGPMLKCIAGARNVRRRSKSIRLVKTMVIANHQRHSAFSKVRGSQSILDHASPPKDHSA